MLNSDVFDNDKIKSLDFTDIYRLVNPIKILDDTNAWAYDYYSIREILNEYSGLPNDYDIKALVEHAPHFTDYLEHGYRVHEIYPSIVCSSFRESIISSVPNNNGVYAVGPYIAYAKQALSDEKIKIEKERLGSNLLVFPAHSTWGIQANYDFDDFCNEIKKVGKEYDSIRVCLYWKDVLLNFGELYKKEGFEVVTAGHMYDFMFFSRLKSLITTSTMTMSNGAGSQIGFSVYLKKPHYLYNPIFDFKKIVEDGEQADSQYQIVQDVKNRFQGVTDLLAYNFSSMEENITKDQLSIVDKYWGINHVKSSKELKTIILACEGYYSLKNNSNNRIITLENENRRLSESVKDINHLKSQINNYEKKLNIQKKKLINEKKLVQNLQSSKSWRITKPLRVLRKKLK